MARPTAVCSISARFGAYQCYDLGHFALEALDRWISLIYHKCCSLHIASMVNHLFHCGFRLIGKLQDLRYSNR
jgi:hypothetical protein